MGKKWGVRKKDTGQVTDPLMVPVRHRLLPLTVVETTEKYLGLTNNTRYLLQWKRMIFGPAVG